MKLLKATAYAVYGLILLNFNDTECNKLIQKKNVSENTTISLLIFNYCARQLQECKHILPYYKCFQNVELDYILRERIFFLKLWFNSPKNPMISDQINSLNSYLTFRTWLLLMGCTSSTGHLQKCFIMTFISLKKLKDLC